MYRIYQPGFLLMVFVDLFIYLFFIINAILLTTLVHKKHTNGHTQLANWFIFKMFLLLNEMILWFFGILDFLIWKIIDNEWVSKIGKRDLELYYCRVLVVRKFVIQLLLLSCVWICFWAKGCFVVLWLPPNPCPGKKKKSLVWVVHSYHYSQNVK